MKKFTIAALITAGLVGHGSVFAAGNAEAGQAKAATCVACHGPDGNSIAPNFPNLAGQGEAYMVKQLQDFKKGERKDATMTAMVMALDDQAVEDVSAFYAAQPLKGGQADPKQVDQGRQIYKGGIAATGVPACMGCHGPTGAGNPSAKFPQLNSQKAAYVEKQLKDFREAAINPNHDENKTGRYNDPSFMMRNAVKQMNDYEIKAVAQYIQGLQP